MTAPRPMTVEEWRAETMSRVRPLTDAQKDRLRITLHPQLLTRRRAS